MYKSVRPFQCGRLWLSNQQKLLTPRPSLQRQSRFLLIQSTLYGKYADRRSSWYKPCGTWSRMLTTRNTLIERFHGDTVFNSPFLDLTFPRLSFAEFMFQRLDQHKDKVLMIDSTTGEEVTSTSIKESSVRAASGLTRLGLRKGDTCLILCNNSPLYTVFTLACAALRLVLTTANPASTSGELARQLLHSKTKAIAMMPECLPSVRQAVNSTQDISNNIKWFISIGGQREGCIPFSVLQEDDGKAFPMNVDICPETDVLFLPYSSGTTGLPKGVMLTHQTVITNMLQLINGPMSLDSDRERLLGLIPFYHIYGLMVIQFGSVCLGTKLVTLPRFEPKTFLTAIKKHKVTYIHLIPPIVLFLAKSPLVRNYDVSSVNTIACGAAPLGSGLSNEVSSRLGCRLLQIYGMTEASPVTHYDSTPPKVGTVGQLLPNTQSKVISVEDGKCLGPGETGEILIKGPQLMKGYLDNQAATDNTIRDGWLHTGDLGHYDEDGYLTISDRLKELIKYRGYRVVPAELEALLLTHPCIQDVAVIGRDSGDVAIGEVARAYVVTKPNTCLKEEDVHKFVDENVIDYKRLSGGVKFLDVIPKSASGKILRRQLKEMFTNE